MGCRICKTKLTIGSTSMRLCQSLPMLCFGIDSGVIEFYVGGLREKMGVYLRILKMHVRGLSFPRVAVFIRHITMFKTKQ